MASWRVQEACGEMAKSSLSTFKLLNQTVRIFLIFILHSVSPTLRQIVFRTKNPNLCGDVSVCMRVYLSIGLYV